MFNSIRIRLTIWYLGVLALIIIAFAAAVYLLVERNLNRTTDENLAERARNVETDLRKEETDIAEERRLREAEKTKNLKPEEPDEDEDEQAKQPEEEEIQTIEQAISEEVGDLRFRDYWFAVFNENGQPIASTVADEQLLNSVKNFSVEATYADLQGENETFRVYLTALELEGKQFRLFATRSLREQTEFLDGLKRIFYVAVPIALLLAGLGGYFLARRSLAPVISMSKQAAKISSFNLNERLPIKHENDELGSLARVFNQLLGRLENSFEQQRRFMADASHELRTPLAIVRAESEITLSKDARTAAEYRESLAIVHDESKRLTRMVEDLFLLARADSGQYEPHWTTIDLGGILAECVRAVHALAEKRKVKIELSAFGEMPLQADESLLHRLFLNLLDNAVKYNREGGAVSVVVEIVGENYRIEISDTGEGISEEYAAKIFERFFRADQARSRNDDETSSGAGLGLSIAAWIVEIHQGSLVLKKSDANGSVFEIELPIRNQNRPLAADGLDLAA